MGVISLHVLLVVVVVVTSAGCVELYTSRGTHYQVGLDVGQHFQGAIQEYYAMMTDLHTKLLPFVETAGGSHIYDTYLRMAETHFPQYVDELRGIAVGAKLSFKQVFTNHIWDELSTLIGVKQKKSCTDVYVNDVGDEGPTVVTPQFSLGHNEDGSPNAKTRAYILHAIIVNNVTGTVEEDFTSFTYPGELPGDAYGFNIHGVVLTMNAVLPVIAGIGAVPRDFVLRATFAVKSQAELESLILSEGTGVGYGYNLNYGNTQDDVRSLVSYEVAPLENQPRALVSKYTVGCHGVNDNTNTTGPYFHFNLYNHTDVVQMTSQLTSSYHRQARVAQIPEVRNTQGALYVLGDTHDPDYPIYRTARPTDEFSTLTTAFLNLVHCRLYIYVDNPFTGSRPFMNLTLPAGRQCH
ncbi:beta-alanyl-dopamine/carcinine hydrolase-like [Haliotis cracherodii]|uniref:beta-alanyl-dopamine/carcinine hydrolase-like n=1 Tax=Haliotis cracherodii TaxID=6455 RepID=UPI0039EB41FE